MQRHNSGSLHAAVAFEMFSRAVHWLWFSVCLYHGFVVALSGSSSLLW